MSKILLCTNHFAPLVGGCEIVTNKIANHLAQEGYEVCVATRRLRQRNPTQFKYLKFLEYTPGDFRRFNVAVRDFDPDQIFVYSDVFDFTRNILGEYTKPLILALCGANWLHNNKNYIRHLYRYPYLKTLICHSEHDRDFKICSNTNLNPKTVVIPNGIDLEEFDENTLTREDLLPGESHLSWILNVSNFFPGKGQEHIPDILRQLPSDKEYVYIQVSSDIDFPIGVEMEHRWQKECALRLKHSPNIKVHHMKNLPREKVIGFFRNSNVFLFSTEKEVAPIVLLEAMASRLPWVSADVGNARGLKGGQVISALKNARFHSVFDSRVKTLFSKAVRNLSVKPSVGEIGRNHVEEMTWQKILPQYASIIKKN